MVLAILLACLQTAGAAPPQEPGDLSPEALKQNEDLLLQKLANPLAALASLKLDLDFDYHIGPLEEGHRTSLLIQPTLPLHLGDQWNLVSRSVLPLIYQEDIFPGASNQTGIGDLTEVVYIAAVQPGRRSWIWGAGPIVRIPTGSEDLTTAKKWCVGPSVAAVRQLEDFTYGLIAAQLWSVGGSGQRPDVKVGSFEAFVTYRAEGLWNLSLHVPCTYDFITHEWIIPVALRVEKLVSFQKNPVTISFGLHYWADSPDSGPHDLAFEFGLTVVFPN